MILKVDLMNVKIVNSLHRSQPIHFSLCKILDSPHKHNPSMFHWIQYQFWINFFPVKCTCVFHSKRWKVGRDIVPSRVFAFWRWTVIGIRIKLLICPQYYLYDFRMLPLQSMSSLAHHSWKSPAWLVYPKQPRICSFAVWKVQLVAEIEPFNKITWSDEVIKA